MDYTMQIFTKRPLNHKGSAMLFEHGRPFILSNVSLILQTSHHVRVSEAIVQSCNLGLPANASWSADTSFHEQAARSLRLMRTRMRRIARPHAHPFHEMGNGRPHMQHIFCPCMPSELLHPGPIAQHCPPRALHATCMTPWHSLPPYLLWTLLLAPLLMPLLVLHRMDATRMAFCMSECILCGVLGAADDSPPAAV